jgi:type IV pilus assembly protein PilM
MVIRNALTRLPSEIVRTTNYYRSQHGGNAPKRVYLCGGGANLPYTLEFFEEKLNLPIEFFNPLKTLAVGKGVETAVLQREAHLMGELVGLGLRGIGKSAINIDLVPAVVEQIRAADRRKPFLIGAAVLFLAGVATWAVFMMLAAGAAEDENRTMTESKETLAPLANDIGTLLKTQAELQAVATSLTSAEADHAFWPDLLAELTGGLASDAVWITDLEPLSNYNPLVTDPKLQASNGRSVVKPDFHTSTYGATGLMDQRGEATEAANAVPNQAAVPTVATANAVRIHGYWRENPDSQNVVSKLLKRLRDKPGSFSFSASGADGAPVQLKDEQILKITLKPASSEKGELAFPFEITLPLARKVSIK